jgi:hypothetical protein
MRAVSLAIALTLAPAIAHAYCRTLTAEVPASQQPSGADCYPAGTQGSLLFWGNACVGWSMQAAPSSKLDKDAATTIVAGAFDVWASAACPGGGKPSIAFTDNGPVTCTTVGFLPNGANQHVVTFRDDAWPHAGQSNATLALTTLTFNKRTGEIVDADMEVNTAEMKISLAAQPPADAYDFQSIVTHEVGHFIGLAHSVETAATMFARYSAGQTSIRALSPDDVAAVCDVYRATGERSVSPAAAASGLRASDACDPKPYGGFSTACDGASSGGGGSTGGGSAGTRRCSFGHAAPRGADAIASTLTLVAVIAVARLRRRTQ